MPTKEQLQQIWATEFAFPETRREDDPLYRKPPITPSMPQELSLELQRSIEAEARNFAWRNYITNYPIAQYDNINTWPDEACTSYYSIMYYLAGKNAAQPEPGRFSVIKLVDAQRIIEEYNFLLTPLLNYGQSKEARILLGASITTVILERAKAAAAMAEALKALLSWHTESLSFDLAGKKDKAIAALSTWTAIGEEKKEERK